MIRHTILLAALCASCASSPDPKPSATAPTPQENAVSSETMSSPDPSDARSATQLGQEATRMFYAGELDALYARFTDQMRAALSPDAWKGAHQQITGGLSSEAEVVGESEQEVVGAMIYKRRVRFANVPDKVFELTWAFDKQGRIAGFNVQEPAQAAPSEYLKYRTKTALMVPFEGDVERDLGRAHGRAELPRTRPITALRARSVGPRRARHVAPR